MNFILGLYIPSLGSSDSQWQVKPLPPGASTQFFLFHLLLTAGHTSSFFPMTAIQIFEDNQILQAINILMFNDPLRKVRVLSLFWFEHTQVSISLQTGCPALYTVFLVWEWDHRLLLYTSSIKGAQCGITCLVVTSHCWLMLSPLLTKTSRALCMHIPPTLYFVFWMQSTLLNIIA